MTTYRSIRRDGLSLIEILIAVMVLSFGLLGVLASIPFGGYQMTRMRDADYTGNLARNAIQTVLMNHWHDPLNLNVNYPNYIKYNDASRVPLFRDGFSKNNDGYCFLDLMNSPTILIDPLGFGLSGQNLDLIFKTKDDLLAGVAENEEGYDFRPTITTEDFNGATIPSFNGQYSWMATATFYEREPLGNIQACPIGEETSFVLPNGNKKLTYATNKIGQVDIDAVIFKGRIIDTENVFRFVELDGSGYQGGRFRIPIDRDRDEYILENMKTTTHLMLKGFSDEGRQIYRWYKIANYKIDGDELIVTLIGSDTPTSWRSGGVNFGNIQAYIYPNVCGVYSKKVLVNNE